MLLSFPTDVTLHILSVLSLHDISTFHLISRQTHAFVDQNESTVYHQAALYHRFAPIGCTIEDVQYFDSLSHRGGVWLKGVRGWKDLCRRWIVLERNWEGQGQVLEGGYRGTDHNAGIMNFKIDDEQKNMIIMLRVSELLVRAMEDNRILWGIKRGINIGSCLFSKGYLVLRTVRGEIEVWRRAADAPVRDYKLPDREDAIPVFQDAPWNSTHPSFEDALRRIRPREMHASVSEDEEMKLRGTFAPHALLGHKDVGTVRMVSFRYPTIAIFGNRDADTVVLVDVRQGTVSGRVNVGSGRVLGSPSGFILPPPPTRVPMDLDVNDDFVTMGLNTALLVVPIRQEGVGRDVSGDGETNVIMAFDERDHPRALRDASMKLEKAPHRTVGLIGGSEDCGPTVIEGGQGYLYRVDGHGAMERFELRPPPERVIEGLQQALTDMRSFVACCFIAARFSPDGRHLAAATAFGVLYIIPDFARVLHGGLTFNEIAINVNVSDGQPVRELEWDAQQWRLVIRTTSEEIYVVNLNSKYHFPDAEARPVSMSPAWASHNLVASRLTPTDVFPHLTVYRLRDFCHPGLTWDLNRGVSFSGLYMTRTALWVGYDPVLVRRSIERRIRRAGRDETDEPQIVLEDDVTGAPVHSICFIDFSPGMQ